MPLAEVCGWGGVTLGLVTTIAQAVRIRRIGTDGVNATTWSLFLLMAMYWIAYGIAVGSPEVIIGTSLSMPLLIWLLVMLDGAERRRGMVRGAASILLAAWLPAAVFGWSVGLLGLGVLMVSTRLPQLLELIRADHADGVSTASWVTGAASVTLWFVYYVSSSMTAAAVTMVLACSANVSIVVMARIRHRGSVQRARRASQLELAVA